MYKTKRLHTGYFDFNDPLEKLLDPNNRWVKLSKLIPWDDVESVYSSLFPAKDGQVAKSARLALGALLIKAELNLSDRQTVSMIQESPYLQFFCGFEHFTQEAPFDSSLMVHFRKRFAPELLAEINEMIIAGNNSSVEPVSNEKPADEGSTDETMELTSADTNDNASNDSPETTPPLKGVVMFDATCVPVNIKYPVDTVLLNDARLKTEQIITEMCTQLKQRRPRTYVQIAKAEYNKFSRNRHRTHKSIRRMKRKQLQYLKRNLRYIDAFLTSGATLTKESQQFLETIRKLYSQQKSMFDSNSNRVDDRIVSVSQPFIRPISRGKTKAPTEFGPKIDISVENGLTRLEHFNYNAYNESNNLIPQIERFYQRTGFYPEVALADKIYRNRENRRYCKERGIRLSGPALGRRPTGQTINKKQDYQDMCDRIEVERKFSLAKRMYGLGLISTKLYATQICTVGIAILLLNLHKTLALFFLCLGNWGYLLMLLPNIALYTFIVSFLYMVKNYFDDILGGLVKTSRQRRGLIFI